jgi:2-polyprenyl-3-methyl-5-hydroxy-6-metoxy-1,4-benzoquinol methylase
VLEIGCGTGSLLLVHLADHFPRITFVGVDTDNSSVVYAKTKFRKKNIEFTTELRGEDRKFDVLILSEVLEHVSSPIKFLRSAAQFLGSEGRGHLILTVPNGYGPFEIAAFSFRILERLNIYKPLTFIRSKIVNERHDKKRADMDPMTLSSSPHINFFSHSEIIRIINKAGFRIVETQNRTLLCGFVLDKIVSRLNISEWNARIANRLPPKLVSDWMFILAPGGSQIEVYEEYTPDSWSRIRRSWNIDATEKVK